MTEFHGGKAQLPINIDANAVQHHWDMRFVLKT